MNTNFGRLKTNARFSFVNDNAGRGRPRIFTKVNGRTYVSSSGRKYSTRALSQAVRKV